MRSCSFAEILVAVPLSTGDQGQVLVCCDTDTLCKLRKHDVGLFKRRVHEAYSLLVFYLAPVAGLVCFHLDSQQQCRALLMSFMPSIHCHSECALSSLITQAELTIIVCRLSIQTHTNFTLQLIVCCDTCAQLCFMESRAQHD